MRSNIAIQALIGILLTSQITCSILLYTYDNLPTSFYQCIKQGGSSKMSTALFSRLPDGFEDGQLQNIINIKSAGLGVEVVYIPCRSRSVQSQINSILKNLDKSLINIFWIYPTIFTTQEECSWDNFPSQFNCMYLRNLMGKLQQNQIKFGFIGSSEQWVEVFGSEDSCDQVSQFPLWWAQMKNMEQNFNDFVTFAGWKKPTLKTINEAIICGSEVLRSYYE